MTARTTLHGLQVAHLHEAGADTEPCQRHLEEVVGAAVEAARGDQLVAALEQREQGERGGGLATRDGERAHAALERGDALLEDVRGGVHDARVDVAELLQREEVRGVRSVPEAVAARLVDGHRARARGGVGLVARVQRERLGTVLRGVCLALGLAHGRLRWTAGGTAVKARGRARCTQGPRPERGQQGRGSGRPGAAGAPGDEQPSRGPPQVVRNPGTRGSSVGEVS